MPIIRRCILCGSKSILKTTRDEVVRVLCRDCDSEFEVEFDPPDAPHLRGRIEIVREPSTQSDGDGAA